MESDELVTRYPEVYHLAEPDAWVGVQRHGLLSTSSLLDLFEVPVESREPIEAARRPEVLRIEHSEHGVATIRDNKPLSESKLAAALDDGLSVEDYLRHLNQHVYFWPTEARLASLLQARSYRDREHLVITVDSAELVRRYEDHIRLSPINSGATVFNAAPRGLGTLKAIRDYDYEERRRTRGPAKAIAELAVRDGVPDVAGFTIRAVIHSPNGDIETLHGS